MLERNIHTYSIKEQLKLHKASAVVLGCGGGGCSMIEVLARTGVGNIAIVDFDVFEDSNLNRQLGATKNTIGQYKVDVINERIKSINPSCHVTIYKDRINPQNYIDILSDKDIIFDAVDKAENKRALCSYVKNLGLMYTTGGLSGYRFWCATLKDREVNDIFGYGEIHEKPCYPCASSVMMQAALEAQQGINCFLNRPNAPIDKIINFNMETLSISVEEIE